MRVAMATLGCKVNQYDTAVFERLFNQRGWRRVGFEEKADTYVINSCTVTDRADSDARKLARKARRTNPNARIVMTGCYAQTSPDEVAALDYVDYVVGLGRVPDLLAAVEGKLAQRAVVSDLRKAATVATTGITSFSGRTRAFVKVQEGCDLFCTFCIIPVARGRSRSVAPRAVVDEIELLAARGYKEVVLTGIHLGGYGADLEPECDLAFLLETIAERRPGLRVRISSIDPPEITERLVDVVTSSRLFCRHFHVPLQACEDDVLARMKRQYTRAQAADILKMLVERIPGVCVGTDMITGFPGETAEQFADGLKFAESLPLDYLHVFPYSKRSSTSAAKRWQELADDVVHGRARRMRELDGDLRRRFLQRNAGTNGEALFETARDGETGLLKGYTDNYVPVLCAGGDPLRNTLAPVFLEKVRGKRVQAVALHAA